MLHFALRDCRHATVEVTLLKMVKGVNVQALPFSSSLFICIFCERTGSRMNHSLCIGYLLPDNLFSERHRCTKYIP